MKYPDDINVLEHGIVVPSRTKISSCGVIATTRIPIYSGFTLTVVDVDGSSLNERTLNITRIDRAHTISDFYEEYDLRYALHSTLYHLNQLITLYARGCQLFEDTYPHPKDTAQGNVSDPRIFYEIDALLGAARRVYEVIRKVLWKHHSSGSSGRWRSIRTAVKSPLLPAEFAKTLANSWDTYGETLADYRDCVAHYDPLTNGQTTCWMDRFDGRWGMTVKLPGNPSEKSRLRFDFESGPDALQYCHMIATHLVKLGEDVTALPAVAKHLRGIETEE
ncbi:hypothetical protein [Nocardia barduliensis]|uniref:hypothetical protein n=1 Tax=Nocardia barduliensis TaxID=2736643 RepID=UPI001574739F|nr:hypothetical protein [Nocardia barduliensis]